MRHAGQQRAAVRTRRQRRAEQEARRSRVSVDERIGCDDLAIYANLDICVGQVGGRYEQTLTAAQRIAADKGAPFRPESNFHGEPSFDKQNDWQAIVFGVGVGLWRTWGGERRVTRRGVGYFALVGLCNGFAVLCWVQSLALGPVSLISPIVACYPVFTLAFGAVLLRQTTIQKNQAAGVLLTVVGIVLLT